MTQTGSNHYALTPIIVASSLISVIFLAFFIKFLFYGLDFTDEAAYLFYIRYPWSYDATGTQFGLVYHPLYWLVGGNIGWLRLANVLILLAVNGFLGWLLVGHFNPWELFITKVARFSLSLGLATISLAVYIIWLPTPNYNLLNVKALGLTLIGMLLVDRQRGKPAFRADKRVSAGWLVVGLGGFLAFMAKPQTAMGLVLVVLAWAWIGSRKNPKSQITGLVAAAAFSMVLVFCSAMALDGSLSDFAQRYMNAREMDSLAGTHSVYTVINFGVVYFLKTVDLLFVAILMALFVFGGLAGYLFRWKSPLPSICFLLALASTTTLLVLANFHWPGQSVYFGHCLWVPLAGFAVFGIVADRRKGWVDLRTRLGWLFFIGCFSILYGLGSNNVFAITTSVGSFYVFLGFFVFLALGAGCQAWERHVFGLTVMGQVLAVAILVTAWANPYRQIGPLWNFSSEAKVPTDGGTLRFPPPMDTFIENWYAASTQAGFVPQTPVIDMTGRTPGASLIIGGYLPKTPWIFSGYAGSGDMAVKALKKLSCVELAMAWLIVDLQGQGNMSTDKISQAGVDFEGEYVLIGQADYPILDVKGQVVFRPLGLLAPRRNLDERTKACQAKRGSELQES